jgi:folate-dependent phosphoribosylglycinamide formyltransferase PurN
MSLELAFGRRDMWSSSGIRELIFGRSSLRSARQPTRYGRSVPDPMRVVLASGGVAEFDALHSACVTAGHVPVAYTVSRSMKPRMPVGAESADSFGRILQALPAGMDLLVPGSGEGLAEAVVGYRPDLMVVYGFNWRLPAPVLRTPTHGAINIHLSLLPRYRGPAPVLPAIRDGATETGLTIHRMDEQFDSGPILVQRGGIPLDARVSPEVPWLRVRPVLIDALTVALNLRYDNLVVDIRRSGPGRLVIDSFGTVRHHPTFRSIPKRP